VEVKIAVEVKRRLLAVALALSTQPQGVTAVNKTALAVRVTTSRKEQLV